MVSANIYTLIYNLGMFCLFVPVLFILRRSSERRSPLLVAGLGILVVFVSLLMTLFYTGTQFGLARLVAWVCFIHCPLYLLGSAVIFRSQSPRTAALFTMLSAVIVSIGVYAFAIEPKWLKVTKLAIHSAKIEIPARLVFIADIQTDRPGKYEERVLETALAQNPDLLLFAGDYIHVAWSSDKYDHELQNLSVILNKLDLKLSSGIFAVAGNVDKPEKWPELFEDLPVVVINSTDSFDLGAFYLTGLSIHDSFSTQTRVIQKDKYHIVLGHSPNFSLGDVEADLLLAGHTHGGQVQLPFIGPIFISSVVPRQWASGMTEISKGKMLVVSQGIGLERMDAPRMRFLCRPEIVVIDLVPNE